MSGKPKNSKSDLIFESLKLLGENGPEPSIRPEKDQTDGKNLVFSNLNVDSIRPKKTQVEYSSVKIKTELYNEIRQVAEDMGIQQPGKFISLILETYLEQARRK